MRGITKSKYNPEILPWIRGGCADYARALQDAAFSDSGVSLELGIHVSPRGIEHVFAHDENNAYDALGVHSLPYKPNLDMAHSEDSEDHYYVEDSELHYNMYPANDERIEEAYEHALMTWQTR